MPSIKSKAPEVVSKGSAGRDTKYLVGPNGKRKLTSEEKAFFKDRTIAYRIIKKFGGARSLARAIAALDEGVTWTPAAIYRWNYPVECRGRGGVIPARAIPYILKAARYAGVLLTIEDFYPGKL